ncbi:MAG: aldo/keto reductase [Pseudomonadota bacterium]|nr:MAG: oxidoreductase [Pseudomonadota bacterium]
MGIENAKTFTLGGELKVHRLGFGAMRLTGDGIWGEPRNRAEALRVLRRAVELGVNFIDTADSYGPEVSEELIAEALYPYPPDLVIATKGGLLRPGPGQWEPHGDPAHLRRACEGSLRRLRLNRIDLYQFHAPDPKVPLERSLEELARLRDEGKIRLVGVSNFDVDQLERALRIVPIASVQNRFNLGDRSSMDVLGWCEKRRIAFIPWRPLGLDGVDVRAVDAIAQRHGATRGQVALAWLLALSPVMLPIPGTSSMAHLEENVAAADLGLSPEEVAELTALA